MSVWSRRAAVGDGLLAFEELLRVCIGGDDFALNEKTDRLDFLFAYIITGEVLNKFVPEVCGGIAFAIHVGFAFRSEVGRVELPVAGVFKRGEAEFQVNVGYGGVVGFDEGVELGLVAAGEARGRVGVDV